MWKLQNHIHLEILIKFCRRRQGINSYEYIRFWRKKETETKPIHKNEYKLSKFCMAFGETNKSNKTYKTNIH